MIGKYIPVTQKIHATGKGTGNMARQKSSSTFSRAGFQALRNGRNFHRDRRAGAGLEWAVHADSDERAGNGAGSDAAGNAEGNIVSIGKPSGSDNQVWIVTRKNGATYALRLKANSNLVLAAKGGGTNNGTQMVLETGRGQAVAAMDDHESCERAMSLLAMHEPTKGLDDLGGHEEPGSKQDLWEYHPGDEHLQWVLKPLAGATVPPEVANGPRLDPLAPTGTVKEFTFNESKIFPGTKRTGNVFIPAQYNPAKPACVYVRQDGYNKGEKKFLESLIAPATCPSPSACSCAQAICPRRCRARRGVAIAIWNTTA